jgi:hypothetical protein
VTVHCDAPGSFGKLSRRQETIVRRFVKDKTVFDLGAGDFSLSRCLVDLGAQKVFAIERATRAGGMLEYGSPYEKVTVLGSSLRSLARIGRFHRRAKTGKSGLVSSDPVETAFVSWPSVEGGKMCRRPDYSLLDPVRKAKTVIYLGNNMDGTVCGSPKLYKHLSRRQVLAHAPERRNTLIVYGRLLRGQERALLPEERAGIDQSRVYRYDEEYRSVGDRELGIR